MTKGIGQRDAAPVVRRDGHAPSGERPAAHRSGSLESEGASGEHAGFSATCQNTSLADWMQLIQMSRRDAVIIVRTPDGAEGRLWCRGGDIIDALWDPFAGEEAVFRILSLEAGEVTVDFSTFERPRAIHTSTTGLLLQAAYQRDSEVPEPRGSEGDEATPIRAAEVASLVPHTNPASVLPERGRPLKARHLFGAAGAAAVAVVLAIAFWLHSRQRSDVPATPRTPGALVAPAAARMEDVALHVEVHPADPPRTHVEDAAPRTAPRAWRAPLVHRAPEPAPEATASLAPTSSPPAPASKPRVQIIDERQPFVRAIDEAQPRIESIE